MRGVRAVCRALALCALLPSAAAAADEYRVTFLSDETPSTFAAGERYSVALTLRNEGTLAWQRSQLFRLSYHWIDGEGKVAVMDGVRTELPRDVAPGGTVALCADLLTPGAGGAYELRWDMVQEGRTWFSARDRTNVLTRTVMVAPADPRLDPRTFVRVATFWLLTAGAFLLAAFWVYAFWGPAMANWDEFAFYAALFGVGHLHFILHVLLFTVGLTLTSAGLALGATHAVMAAVYLRSRSRQRHAPVERLERPRVLEVLGASVILSLLVQWAWASSGGMEILGTDAANYHVPHALNFLHGVNPFTFLATPHIYPMGTSVWAAWFFVPFNDPLLLELATAPAFLLLFASACLLFRLLTGRSGLAWIPWALLFIFTGQMLRVSMLMSADLAYAAASVALTTQLLMVWDAQRIDDRALLGAALCGGWLLSAKSTGVFSLAYLSVLAAAIVFFLQRRGRPWRGVKPPVVAAAVVTIVGSGGIWIVRNWWLYGLPIAPYGLSFFGMRIFPGSAAGDTRYYLSVLGDLQRDPGYPLAARLSEYIGQMFGGWALPAGLLALLLPIDAGLQVLAHGGLSRRTWRKLGFAGLVVLGFAVHAVVVAGLPWTSLEWTNGVSLRYLLPCFLLSFLTLYSCAFLDAVRPPGSRVRGALQAVGATALIAGALFYYRANAQTPGLPPDRWIGVLSPATLMLAAALTVAACLAIAGRFRPWTAGILASLAAAALIGLSRQSALDHARVVRSRAREARQESSCVLGGMAAAVEHRAFYLRIVGFQASTRASCDRTRFFVVSRFDRPLDLQDAEYRNLVLDARVSSTAAMRRSGPRPDGCDIVVATRSDISDKGMTWLGDVLHTRAAPDPVAEYGRYVAYVMK